MFARANRSTGHDASEKKDQPSSTPAADNPTETEESQPDNAIEEKSSPQPTSIFVTTINPDSSITEENMPITPSTPTAREENTEKEPVKFVPLERKVEYSFIMLITTQGQEVLKSNHLPLTREFILLSSVIIENWSFFAGSLQQRLNVTVTNVSRVPRLRETLAWEHTVSKSTTGPRVIWNEWVCVSSFGCRSIPSLIWTSGQRLLWLSLSNYRNSATNNGITNYLSPGIVLKTLWTLSYNSRHSPTMCSVLLSNRTLVNHRRSPERRTARFISLLSSRWRTDQRWSIDVPSHEKQSE